MAHLTPEQMLDVAEGTSPQTEFPHLDACSACTGQVAELRRVIAVASAVEVPEPSPLFWDHLAARVRQAVAEEPQHAARRPWFAPAAWGLVGGAAVAAVLVAVMVGIVNRARPASPDAPAVAALDPSPAEVSAGFDDDAALTLLADLTSGIDWETAAEAGLVPAQGTVDMVVFAFSAEERLELHRILEEALSASGA